MVFTLQDGLLVAIWLVAKLPGGEITGYRLWASLYESFKFFGGLFTFFVAHSNIFSSLLV